MVSWTHTKETTLGQFLLEPCVSAWSCRQRTEPETCRAGKPVVYLKQWAWGTGLGAERSELKGRKPIRKHTRDLHCGQHVSTPPGTTPGSHVEDALESPAKGRKGRVFTHHLPFPMHVHPKVHWVHARVPRGSPRIEQDAPMKLRRVSHIGVSWPYSWLQWLGWNFKMG